ncbi:MarR family winged helix-turn-helix transcriptional regulator [Rhodococcus koreensis]
MTTAADRIEFETMLLTRHLTHPRRGTGHLDNSAYLLLSRISTQGPMSVGELSEAFGLDTSTLSRQTTAMLNSRLVQRIPDPDGGMARKFLITNEGRARLEEERAGKAGGIANLLATWDDDDRTTLANLLERFNLEIEQHTGREWPRPVAHGEAVRGA